MDRSRCSSAAGLLLPLARVFIRFTPPSSVKEHLWRRFVCPRLTAYEHAFVVRSLAGTMAGVTSNALQRHLYYFGVWQPQVTAFILRRLRPGDTFVDVGAGIGYFSLLAARRVGAQGSVISIEASSELFTAFSANIERNGATIRALNLAASDARGKLLLFSDADRQGGPALRPVTKVVRRTTIQTAPLDEIISSEEALRARLIKIDADGAEAAVAAGMRSLLAREGTQREFLVRLQPQRLGDLGQSYEDVCRPFHQAGYKAYLAAQGDTADAYLWPAEPQTLLRLHAPIAEDATVVFSRVDSEQL